MPPLTTYGIQWSAGVRPIDVELEMIRQGGYINLNGTKYGQGLFQHYLAAQKLLWPDDDHHRWADLILRRTLENEITVIMGPGDSGKSYGIASMILTDWWAQPDITLWMISSTELRGAELRIWGAIKQLFNRARERYDDLPGTVLESKHAITTEEISEDGSEARLLTKGLIFIPCKQGDTWVGMGAYAGVKPVRYGGVEGRLGHVGDEASVMNRSFLDAYSNWFGKPNFKGILTGNPINTEDPLCIAAEPEGGWDAWRDSQKTQEWTSTFYGAHVIALDGRDSPNFDFPDGDKVKFPYLIGRKKIDAVSKTHGITSYQFYNQCVGKPCVSADGKRVLTKQICEANHAFDEVVWEGSDVTKVGFMDAAYGSIGGDRCICGHLLFGRDVEGRNVIAIQPLVTVPVSVLMPEPPEIQIAKFVKQYCVGREIPPQNFFFDGRGTLAVILAREWSTEVNVVDFGGPATKRPVSMDEYVWDGDQNTRRLKRCDEHYSKFVSELWYSMYYLVIGNQMRQLPRDAAQEGYRRAWEYTTGNRIEVEPKKEMKLRTNQSPDLMDAIVAGVEGARRLGFIIENMKGSTESRSNVREDWLAQEVEKHQKFLKQNQLTYS